MRRTWQRGRPPWWPENEPWPPRHRAHEWRAGRVRFFRLFALTFVAVLSAGIVGTVSLVWAAAARLGIVAPGATPGSALFVVGGGLAGAAMTALVLLGTMRRIGRPLGAVMDAAGRVADGDYGVRVAEQGPRPFRALARAFNTMTERLENHDRQRRDLMADLSHELRTPVTVLQGKLEGLLDGVYPRDDDQLAALLEETGVLSRLIDDLRTLSLAESGALQLQTESTDIADLAREVADGFAASALAGRVTVAVDAPPELPSAEVDPIRVREVIANLLSNALRHTPAGGSIVVHVGATAGAAIQVEVRDTGAGMTPDEVARAFDRFHKGPGSRGSGLGLTIAKNLVAAHGGQIHVSSEVGKGTTVSVTLPLRRDDRATA